MTEREAISAQALAVARRLAGESATLRQLASGGRNSRIYRVDSGGKRYALKQYPSKQFDPRDRLATEAGALQLMEQAALAGVPRVIAVDGEAGYVLMSWLDGAVPGDIGDGDIDAAAAFLRTIHHLRTAPCAIRQGAAAEACLSGEEIERQLSVRLASLRVVAAGNRELSDFLEKTFRVAHRKWLAEAQARLAAVKRDFAAELPQERQTLVPSDFGFHNSLRQPDGSLAFVDFEYFGWDDPVKLTADILLHPGHELSTSHRHRFRQAAISIYGTDVDFESRLMALLPLFGLRWTLILLNEFIPERWQNRVLAGTLESWDAAKARQLDRARKLLSALAAKVRN